MISDIRHNFPKEEIKGIYTSHLIIHLESKPLHQGTKNLFVSLIRLYPKYLKEDIYESLRNEFLFVK